MGHTKGVTFERGNAGEEHPLFLVAPGKDGIRPWCDEDAYLWAAAPRLLAALERAVNLYGSEGGPWNIPSNPGAWIAQARASIAAAKGPKPLGHKAGNKEVAG